jgi:hypothetical protein
MRAACPPRHAEADRERPRLVLPPEPGQDRLGKNVAGGAIAEAEIRSWTLFAWSVAAYTVGCSALMWWNQRRVGVAMKYFDSGTRAVFAAHVLTVAGLIAIACWLGLDREIPGAFLAAGVLAVPVTVVFGRWTDRLLRARLHASP